MTPTPTPDAPAPAAEARTQTERAREQQGELSPEQLRQWRDAMRRGDETARDWWHWSRDPKNADRDHLSWLSRDIGLAILCAWEAWSAAPPAPGDAQPHARPTDAGELARQVEHLRDVLHRDQTGLAAALASIVKTVEGYSWVAQNRGPYEWDDDEYRKEMGRMLDDVGKQAADALTASGKLAHRECCGRGLMASPAPAGQEAPAPPTPAGEAMREAVERLRAVMMNAKIRHGDDVTR